LRYRLLIFDFDGTLADSFALFVKQVRQVAERFGLRKMDALMIDQMRGLSAKDIIKELRIPCWKVPLMARYMRKLMREDAARSVLFPGASELLQRLKNRGALIAIVSSNVEANIRTVLGPDTARVVDVFDGGSSLFGKAAKFRKVLKKTGVNEAHTLAVGDEIRDLEAAREVGIPFGAVSWGYTKVEALRAQSPNHVFSSLEDLNRL
jgi:phosphoglycolate phosphatase